MVETIDHATREELVDKYRPHNVDVSQIETVDWVWKGEPLDELLGPERHGAYDFFIASHVIEHFPDLLGFLRNVENLLRVGGVLSLVIPDKRYCFDFFKPLQPDRLGSIRDIARGLVLLGAHYLRIYRLRLPA